MNEYWLLGGTFSLELLEFNSGICFSTCSKNHFDAFSDCPSILGGVVQGADFVSGEKYLQGGALNIFSIAAAAMEENYRRSFPGAGQGEFGF